MQFVVGRMHLTLIGKKELDCVVSSIETNINKFRILLKKPKTTPVENRAVGRGIELMLETAKTQQTCRLVDDELRSFTFQ